MGKMMRFLILSLMIALGTHAAADQTEPAPIQGYTTETLRNPIFDAAHTAVNTARFSNWLTENIEKIPPQKWPPYREHLYELINSQIIQNYDQTGLVMPKDDDLILMSLFMWAERLGVYGGAQVYNRVRPKGIEVLPVSLPLPGDFQLKLEGDLFHLSTAQQGWKVYYPYFFMLHDIRAIRTTEGHTAAIITLSTGTAWHTDQTGKSQATIMLIVSPDAEPAAFESYWNKLFGLEGISSAKLATRADLASRHVADYSFGPNKDKTLHREFTSWRTGRRMFGVMYSGLDGTYQWNHRHFEDFINAMSFSAPGVTPKEQ
ncbi:hypothetical protein [Kordiimonas lacus]|nr:hypothetical protein [Kordiimonas lacus]